MAHRSQKAVGAFLILLAVGARGAEPEFRYKARHDHLRKGGEGLLVVTPAGIAFEETEERKRPHSWKWSWHDIQQLTIAPRRITVLTYQDSRWMLGADRQYRFDLIAGDDDFAGAYEMLKGHLDQRLVAALPAVTEEPLWRLPAKHLLRFGGQHGTLVARRDGLVFQADSGGESRTWRWQDIENVSRTGPFRLTVTTYERSRGHYGNLKGFNFQLKEALPEARYDDLWRRLNAGKGLTFLQIQQEENTDHD
jgi:hypothetical protein